MHGGAAEPLVDAWALTSASAGGRGRRGRAL